VPIDQVRPNTWNPKDKNTEEYEKVKLSIQKRIRQPIIVRETDTNSYEIIDGEQRWTACKELAFENVLVYNEGKVSDQEARELTIFFSNKYLLMRLNYSLLLKK